MNGPELTKRFTAYLQRVMPETREIRIENPLRYTVGASKETWSVDACWCEGGKEIRKGLVVRRSPAGAGPLDSEPAIEFNLYRRLRPLGIPVPRVNWLEEDPAWLDAPFYVMERIDGASSDMAALLSPANAHLHPVIIRQLAEILAATHRVDAAGYGFLGDRPRPEECAPREVAYWERVMHAEQLEPQPALEAIFRWLKRHPPAPAQQIGIVHADYRSGNYLYNERGIVAMLDWEMAHLGDPMEDVGWLYMMSWSRTDSGSPGALGPWEDFARQYAALSGVRVDPTDLKFWEIFSNMKLAVILKTGGWRFARGATSELLQAMLGVRSWPSDLRALELIGNG